MIRPGAIGDCILSLPALEFLNTGDTEIWVPSPVVPLIRFAGRVRSIASTRLDMVFDTVPETLVQDLRSFDEIVSWYGTNRSDFRKAVHAIHPNCTFLSALPSCSGEEHATDFFLRQIAAPLGGMARIPLPAVPSRDSIAIHPGSGSLKKNWPLSSYQALACRLPNSEWAQDRYQNLWELALWIKGCCAYVGNDSGITHLAAAAGVPVLALFGPTDPAVWAPRGEGVQVLRHQPLSELAVDAVWKRLVGG